MGVRVTAGVICERLDFKHLVDRRKLAFLPLLVYCSESDSGLTLFNRCFVK